MRIAFLDVSPINYTIDSVYQIPLGGSSSAVCYLAEQLAQQGQEVFLLNKTTTACQSRQVWCLPFETLSSELRQSLDVLVVVNLAGEGKQLRQSLSPGTRLILWTQHAADQPAMQALQDRAEQDCYDRILLVSEWQREQFCQQFGIDPQKTQICRNAISPVFADRFSPEDSILAQKSVPPVLAYTSTPFRGLDILLEVFPGIRAAVPGTTLKVFSSMKVYNLPDRDYEPLYRQCQETEGVEYVGSVSQPQLAETLRSVLLLAYPNTFAETSCISVMEAMASGCTVITSNLGALPETTAGFAELIAMTDERERYKQDFITAVVNRLQTVQSPARTRLESDLRKQVEFVNHAYSWRKRAEEWLAWLTPLVAGTSLIAWDSPELLVSEAHCLRCQGDYRQATSLYERAIELDSTNASNYWYLGLTFLLDGQIEAAQEVWFAVLLNGDLAQVEQQQSELVQILQAERDRQMQVPDSQTVAMLEQCLRDLSQ